MDGPTPHSPYRADKPLADVIPPDRRMHRAIALVAVSMIAGIAIWKLGGYALDAFDHPEPTAVPVMPAPIGARTMIGKTLLTGPDGTMVVIPTGTSKAVVNVWLMGCADCMPAFEAFQKLDAAGEITFEDSGAKMINVAYGEVDPAWAARYGVRKNLVQDQTGSAIVSPLGISSFTTLVIDETGHVILRDRPDRPGYIARVREALGMKAVTAEPPDSPGSFDTKGIETVVRTHSTAMKRACWENRPDDSPASASISASVRVAKDGHVASVDATGNDPTAARCVERQIKTWKFPAPSDDTTVVIPFRFIRQ